MTGSRSRTLWRLLGLVMAVGTLVWTTPPSAIAGNCIAEKAGRKLTCTANDIRIAWAENPRDLKGEKLEKCIQDQIFSFIADYYVMTNASARFDIGLFFATDGDPNRDGALSGDCSVNMLTPEYLDPVGGVVMLGTQAPVDLDGDKCLDVNTANGWGPPLGRKVTIRVDNVKCAPGPTGLLNLPYCTSWSQNAGGNCQTPDQTVPGSPSKCGCDRGFEVPIRVDQGRGAVTKEASPKSLPEPGGEFTYTISFKNTSEWVQVVLNRICDDKHGTIALAPGQAACDPHPGPEGPINATTCVLPNTLAPGERYECQFTADFFRTNVTSGSVTLTNTVTFHGHDTNTVPNPVKASAVESVTIADVSPSGRVIKSLDDLQCAVVRYKVKVANDSPETGWIKLTKLVDSAFGDITKAATACDIRNPGTTSCVTRTTCDLGTGIAITDQPYECAFDAYFCGASHTNTVMATWNDGRTEEAHSSNAVSVELSVETR